MRSFFILSSILLLISSCTTTDNQSTSTGNVIPEKEISSKEAITPEQDPNQVNIAVLVPLYNEKDKTAESILGAAQLALMEANNPNINLIPIDSELLNSSPESVVSSLINQNIKIILGPIFANETETLVKTIEGKEITILSLSNDSTLKDDSLLVLGVSPSVQAEILTRYAISQGISDYHLLLPSSKYGKMIEESVTKILSAKDKTTYNINWYGTENIDQVMSEFLSSLISVSSDKSAIFMPQGGENLNRLEANLAKYSVKARLVGSQAWHYDSLLKLNNFENAILLQHNFYPAKFAREYHKYFKYKPSNITYAAYNGVLMLAKMDKDQQLLNKRNIIINNDDFGKYADFKFNSEGLAIYQIPVLEVHNKQFKVMENPQ